jgi:hypothetical protein
MYKIMILSLMFSVVGCTNNHQKRPQTEEIFVTKIEENGTKRFNFSMNMEIPSDRRGGRPAGAGGGRPGGMGGGRASGMGGGRPDGNKDFEKRREQMMEKMKKNIYEKLRLTLFNTEYCREEYIEIDSIFIPGNASIKGECEEKATQEDILKFPNQQ